MKKINFVVPSGTYIFQINMAAIIKFVRGVRNHWKKSIFASVLIGYGVKYALDVHECNEIMRVYCEEAKSYGKQPIIPTEKPRHVTVLLNPTSSGGKGKVLFDKYAAPILHLAGIKVSLVRTEHEGQARALMEVMDNTDAVVISGGNGTVLEAVTGLMRRNDSFSAAKNYPLAVIPIGNTNSLANNMFRNYSNNEARYIAECAIALVRDTKKSVDVMRISNDEGKEIFAVSDLEWSAYQDTKSKMSKFWLFGPLKSKVVYLSDAIRNWPNVKSAHILYSPPCKGCSSCYTPERDVQPPNTRWWQAFKPKLNMNHNMGNLDYSKIVNEICNTWTDLKFRTMNLKLSILNNRTDMGGNESIPSISLLIDPENVTRTEFIKEGWRRLSMDSTDSLVEGENNLSAKIIKVDPQGDIENEWFRIDNENFEAKSVQVEILTKRVQVFCPKEKIS